MVHSAWMTIAVRSVRFNVWNDKCFGNFSCLNWIRCPQLKWCTNIIIDKFEIFLKWVYHHFIYIFLNRCFSFKKHRNLLKRFFVSISQILLETPFPGTTKQQLWRQHTGTIHEYRTCPAGSTCGTTHWICFDEKSHPRTFTTHTHKQIYHTRIDTARAYTFCAPWR